MKYLQLFILFITIIIFTPNVSANTFFSQFMDPKDGKIDLSQWLGGRSGFLPVPIIISDPAVGYGGGLALAYFHDKLVEGEFDENTEISDTPPSISFLAGAGTENGTWLVAGGHLGNWKSDSIRYLGAGGYGAFNLTFYGLDSQQTTNNESLKFEMDALFILQQVLFRVKESNFFLGGKFTYLNVDNNFKDNEADSNIPDDQLNSQTAGLGFVAHYDSRDNILSPSSGQYVKFDASYYSGTIIGDFDFGEFGLTGISYWPVADSLNLGFRLQGDLVTGDTPFYQVPYIDLRGIPALRYQGEKVIVGEIEARWDFTYRWSLVGFVGSGWAADNLSDMEFDDAKVAGGGGIRYLIARLFGLRVGVDIAVGPEDTVAYLGVGSSWN